MKRLSHVFAHNLAGRTFFHELPPRLLLTGANGTGKTLRLTAIREALRGPGRQDGLRPWCPNAEDDELCVGVLWDEGRNGILRKTEIGEGGHIRSQTMMPRGPGAMIIKADAAAEALARDLAPNLFVLDLAAFLKKSGADRRRAMLTLLSKSATNATDVEGGMDRRLKDNGAWEKYRNTMPAEDDPFTWLASIEKIAKEQVRQAKETVTGIDAQMLRLAPDDIKLAGMDTEQVETRLAEINNTIDDQAALRETRARLNAVRRQKMELAERASGTCMEYYLDADHPGDLGITVKMVEALRGDLNFIRKWILKRSASNTETFNAARSQLVVASDAKLEAEVAWRSAASASQSASGALAAVRTLSSQLLEGSPCFLCGGSDFKPDTTIATIKAATDRVVHAHKDEEAAEEYLRNARTAMETWEAAYKTAGHVAQVSAIALQGLILFLGTLVGDSLAAADVLHRRKYRIAVGAESRQRILCFGVHLHQPQQQVLDGCVLVPHFPRGLLGLGQHGVQHGVHRHAALGRLRWQPAEFRLDHRADPLGRDAHLLQQRPDEPAFLAQQRIQQMQRGDSCVPALGGAALGGHQRFLRFHRQLIQTHISPRIFCHVFTTFFVTFFVTEIPAAWAYRPRPRGLLHIVIGCKCRAAGPIFPNSNR